jgi:Pentapeptide repeats (9 copies)
MEVRLMVGDGHLQRLFSTRTREAPGSSYVAGLNQGLIIGLVLLVLTLSVAAIYLSQAQAERGSLGQAAAGNLSQQRQVEKLTAEIQKIRSETAGGLFWLKLIGLFVTVGSAVGGYLLGQSRVTRARLKFEKDKEVDQLYQSIVAELASESPLLRAAAAVKLGRLLESFPRDWELDPERRAQFIDLTKRVLASSLTIEHEPKVLKTLTIALPLHKPWSRADDETMRGLGDLRGLDLSWARAADAFWADVDFTGTDFYRAELRAASFRRSILRGAQFRDAVLNGAVLAEADCGTASFKQADLRHANLEKARNWHDCDVQLANVYGAKPGEFVAWALANGAVAEPSDERWRAMLNGGPHDPASRARAAAGNLLARVLGAGAPRT